MTDREIAAARQARHTLYASAQRYAGRCTFASWLNEIAPQWALELVTQREVDAIFGMLWEIRKKRAA